MVRVHLRNIESYLQLSLDEMYSWKPTREGVERVRYLIRGYTRDDVRTALLDSTDGALVQLTGTEEDRELPEDLPGIVAMLRQNQLDRPHSRKLERQLWAKYEAEIEKLLVSPLIQQALEAMNPTERSRLFAIAGVNRIVHPAAEVFAADFARRIAKVGIRKAGSIIGTKLEPLLKFYTILLNLIKAGK